ncbi:hypothetical protein BXZ70DRAFT_147051 [Cristinia sonorae]|uniref:Uncharacterized protein n=1 Tax=Cristinia sonorae TaxID=1940300 RepID=A0A8K0UNQ7_9AGAR|nr:hypothetical protein BXZ70DRAFT_147051 [Cristinia sonorae]
MSHVAAHLLCLPKDQVIAVNATSPVDEVVSAIGGISTRWPSLGSVIVDINKDNGDPAYYHSWIPVDLVGPLDVSPYIKPGKNTARFIQLADLSEFVFVLHATKPSDEVVAQLAERAEQTRKIKEYARKAYPGSTS